MYELHRYTCTRKDRRMDVKITDKDTDERISLQTYDKFGEIKVKANTSLLPS